MINEKKKVKNNWRATLEKYKFDKFDVNFPLFSSSPFFFFFANRKLLNVILISSFAGFRNSMIERPDQIWMINTNMTFPFKSIAECFKRSCHSQI